MLSRSLFSTSLKNIKFLNKNLVNTSTQNFARQILSSRLEKLKKKTITDNLPQGSTIQDVINNTGKIEFLKRVYATTGISLVGAFAISQYVMSSGYLYYHPGVCLFGGAIATLGGFIGSSLLRPKQYVETKNGSQIIKSSNSIFRLGLYSIGCVGLGMMSSKLFMMANTINPAILPTAIALSTSAFGAASLYAYTRPKDSLLSWQSALFSGLLGMIGIQIVAGLSSLAIGPNLFSYMAHRFDTYAGVGLFSAFVAYDTHVALKQYDEGIADHLNVSVEFVLDFWNILIRMVEILSIFSGRD